MISAISCATCPSSDGRSDSSNPAHPKCEWGKTNNLLKNAPHHADVIAARLERDKSPVQTAFPEQSARTPNTAIPSPAWDEAFGDRDAMLVREEGGVSDITFPGVMCPPRQRPAISTPGSVLLSAAALILAAPQR
jgi:hypothetical protein